MSQCAKINSAAPNRTAAPPAVHAMALSKVFGPYALQIAANTTETMMAMSMGASVSHAGWVLS